MTIIIFFLLFVFSGLLLQLRFIQRDINATKAIYLAEASIYQSIIDSLNTPPEYVELDDENFGGYRAFGAKAHIGQQQKSIQFLLGANPDKAYETSIILQDSTTQLTITGNSNISGDIITFGDGLITSSFRGAPFQGSINSQPIQSEEDVPIYKTELITQELLSYDKLLLEPPSHADQISIREFENLSSNNADTILIDDDIELERNLNFATSKTLLINGNAIISGDVQFAPFTSIFVSDSLKISGTITGQFLRFYAGDYIDIIGNAQFSAQVLSNGSIQIQDEVYLTYPSFIYSGKERYAGGSDYSIAIQDKAIVDGVVAYGNSPNLAQKRNLRLFVDTTATVRGLVYSEGFTELHGTVFGTVHTDQFYFYDAPTEYINWLKDATIDVTRRPTNMVLPLGFGGTESPRYEILDWRIIE